MWCSSVLVLALDAARPSVIHHLLPAFSWGTRGALEPALRNQLKQHRPCQCVCVFVGGVFKHVAHFSMLCFSLFLVVIFYLSNCNNGLGRTMFQPLYCHFFPCLSPRLSLYDHLKTFFNDPYLAFRPPLLLSIHLFFLYQLSIFLPLLSSEADINSSSRFDRCVLESQ